MTRTTRRIFRVALTACIAMAFFTPAQARNPVMGQGETLRGISWLYDSPLNVYEEIEALGDGTYSYTYRFQNVDDKHIWHFCVFTEFNLDYTTHTWESLPVWELGHGPVDSLYPEYDPRNINPDLAFSALTWGPFYPDTPDPISPGDSVAGFAFQAPFLDERPKLYLYETVEDGYAHETGYIAAVGYTVPGPVASKPSSWGSIKALFR